MSEIAEQLQTSITVQKNHIEVARFVVDFHAKRVHIEAILSAEQPDGTLTDAELISFGSNMQDPGSFNGMIDDLFPDDDTVINPRKSIRKYLKKMVKKVLAQKYHIPEENL